jgi:putative spermidine/putrescine transport system permease protein
VTTTNLPVGRAGSTKRRVRLGGYMLLLPAYALLIGVFAYPLLESVWRSFSEPSLGVENYVWAIEGKNNLKVIIRTFANAAGSMLICLLLAYPYAYLMTTVGRRARNLLVVVALIPFWTSLMIRTFAWIVLLQDTGMVNQLFELFGLGPFKLIRTNTGVMIGLTQVLMPFMILPLYAVMSGIDQQLVTAARSLGAKPAVAFFRVFVPLSVPGIAAGGLLVFIQALGFYVTPALLGAPSGSMLSQTIYTQVSSLLNWGRGGALGVVLLIGTFVLLGIIGIIAKFANKRGMAMKVF